MKDTHPDGPPQGSRQLAGDESGRPAVDPRRERDVLLSLVESITDEIWFADADGRVSLVNPAVLREFGALDGDSIETIAERFEVYRGDGTPRPPAEAPPLRTLCGETIRDEEEIVRTPATGELRHRMVSGAPVRDGDGAIIGSVCVVRDVTERRRAEQALQESEARFRSFVEAGSDVVFRMGADWRELLQLRGGGFVADSDATERWLETYVHPEDQAMVLAAIERAVAARSIIELEHRVLRADGSVGWTFSRAVPLLDADGEITEWLGTATDITARKLIEEELKRSREDFDRAQAVGQIGSWRLDVRENVLTWSDENYRIFGVPFGAPLTYEAFLAVVHPDDREYVDERWQASLRGEPYDVEHRLLVAGQVKWVRQKAFLEHDEAGELLGGFGITQDVTERKAAEEALRESEARHATQQERARLARDLHDSVSQAIFAAALKAEALDLAGECADDIGPAAQHVCRLCKGALADLRTMLRELRGEGLEEVAMQQLLRQLAEATEGRTSAQVELAVEETAQLPPDVHVTFYRVVQEALNNVARHARADHAWVTGRLSQGEAILEVRDDGRGFEWRDFGPGHLGLRMMRERAAEVGADLRIESAKDEGTSVTIAWRMAAAG